MYRLLIKLVTTLISIVYSMNFLDEDRLALVILVGLATSFFIDLVSIRYTWMGIGMFMLVSVLYPCLFFVYPLVLPSAAYCIDEDKILNLKFKKREQKGLFIGILVLLFSTLCFVSMKEQFIVKNGFNRPVEMRDYLLVVISYLAYLAALFDHTLHAYQHQLYNRDDDYHLQISEQKKLESKLLLEKSKDIEIAILQERNRISRELHDSVGHTISGAIIQSEAMRNEENQQLNAQIDALQSNLKKGMMDIRSSIHSIHDQSLDLEMSIKEVIANVPMNIDLNYKVNSDFTYQVKSNLLSIIKEAFANSMKYSHADSIRLSLIEMPQHVSLVVEEKGSKSQGTIAQEGMGFISFKEFVKAYHGRFVYEFIPHEGLRLLFLLEKNYVLA